MELILLLKKEWYYGESLELKSKEDLINKLNKISYKSDGTFDEYEVHKIVQDKEVDERLEFSIYIKEDEKIFSVEEYLNKG